MSAVLAYAFARRLEKCAKVSSLRRVNVARFFFSLAARHPADMNGVSYRWCPGTDLDDMVSVPLRASTALHSAVLASVLFLSKSGGYGLVVVFYLDGISFLMELSCLSHDHHHPRRDHHHSSFLLDSHETTRQSC